MKGLPAHEQRRAFRFPVDGFAVVRDGRVIRRCSVRNLSPLGGLFRGRTDAGPGGRVAIELAIAGIPELTVKGQLVRQTTDPLRRDTFAVAFDEPLAEDEDMIHDLSLMVLERVVKPGVLIVETESSRRRTLARLMYRQGWRVVTVDAPLQAIVALERESGLLWAVVCEQVLRISGLDLLRHVRLEHPHMRAALVVASSTSDTARRAVDDELVDRLICDPVDPEQVSALGGPPEAEPIPRPAP